jgi:MSHA biogenesis protein MshJ
MTALWDQLSARLDALSRRERWMILIALLAAVVALMDVLLMDSVWTHHRSVDQQLTGDRAQVEALALQLRALQQSPVQDPDAAVRRQLQALEGDLVRTDDQLNALQQQLVTPEKMSGLLQDILKRNSQLKLVSLKTLPTETVTVGQKAAPQEDKDKKNDASAAVIYQHGVELTVQGRYLDLMQYLSSLEQLPWHLRWGTASLKTETYPDSTLVVTISTFSLDKAWLSI